MKCWLLQNLHGRIFYGKLTSVYPGMPDFTKSESELENRPDKWLLFVKNLEDYQNILAIFKAEVFEKAALANLGQADLDKYENSLKGYRDLKGVIDTAFDDGKKEVARLMKQAGEPVEKIEKYTGLFKDAINKL